MLDPAPDIFTGLVIFKPRMCSAGNGPVGCPLMRFMGQVIPSMNRRGIALKFTRDGRRAPLENLRDLPNRFSFAFEDR